MIAWAGWQVELASPQIDESILDNEMALDYVKRIAVLKASKRIDQAQPDDFIIAADTIVVNKGKILGKPADTRSALDMLSELRDRTHWVITALAVRKTRERKPLTDICHSKVNMRAYTDAEMRDYIESGDPFDKAGAYAIQDPVFRPALDFRGCFASVMGLPLCHLERTLRKYSGYSGTEWAKYCQKELKYKCPITRRVMAGEDIG